MEYLPRAAIFDIDGTLAHMNDRSPYEWDKVGEDKLDTEIALLLRMFHSNSYTILIFSGRDSSCREITEKWLSDYGILYDELHMRSHGDTRKDVEVKKEFYDDCSQRYCIKYAIDDRPQVCRLWFKLGLCLLKVGDPDLEF